MGTEQYVQRKAIIKMTVPLNAASIFMVFLVFTGAIHGQEISGPAPALPGRMVDIGGYRLHIDCAGKGSPTVILENGLGDNFADWALIQPEIAKFTRVCSYDRAYDGFSDAGPIPVTMHQEVFELHKLLAAARVRPPYILVGHSYGGILARLYASTYSSEVVGMVSVDSVHEDVQMGGKMFRDMAKGTPVPPPQTMKTSPPLPFTAEEQKSIDQRTKQLQEEATKPIPTELKSLPPEAIRLDRWAHTHPKFPSNAKGVQGVWLAEEFQQIHDERIGKSYPFGNIPIVVLGARKANPDDFEIRQAQLKDMASLSRNSRLVIDEVSSHHIQWDNPSLVIHSINDVFEATKKHSALEDRH